MVKLIYYYFIIFELIYCKHFLLQTFQERGIKEERISAGSDYQENIYDYCDDDDYYDEFCDEDSEEVSEKVSEEVSEEVSVEVCFPSVNPQLNYCIVFYCRYKFRK